MKNVINYYYNLVVDKIYKRKNMYFFFNDEKYYISKCNDSKRLKDVYNLVKSLFDKDIIISELIDTKDGKLSFAYMNEEYVIIKVPSMEKVGITLDDILKYNISVGNSFDFIKSNEYSFMTELVDYYEEKMIGYTDEFPLVQMYFNYYVGLAENSISYLKDILDGNSQVVYSISHKRIRYLYLGELFDITNISYSYRMRDISEYIKCKIIKHEEWVSELELFFNNFKLNLFDYEFLYCFSIFPDYFFDIVKEVTNEEIKEEEVKKILEDTNYYEKELVKLYNLICKYCQIPKIEWLK